MKQQVKTKTDTVRVYTRDRVVLKKTAEGSGKVSGKTEVSTWFYVGKVGQIGYTVSLPIVVGALIGVYIDRQWSTYPKATLACLFGGLFLSTVNFIRLIIELIRTPE